MTRAPTRVTPTAGEVARPLPGDDLVPDATTVMDRAFTLPAPPAEVWPWLVQLGKRRAGWYLPRVGRAVAPALAPGAAPPRPRWQGLAVGDVIPDWGGRDETFTVTLLDPPHALVHTSRRGRTDVSWALCLTRDDRGTRLQLRLRLGPVRHPRLVGTLGEAFDWLTVRGLAAGLAERLGDDDRWRGDQASTHARPASTSPTGPGAVLVEQRRRGELRGVAVEPAWWRSIEWLPPATET